MSDNIDKYISMIKLCTSQIMQEHVSAKIRWRSTPLDVTDILTENVPQFIKNNKIRYRHFEEKNKYDHILIIKDKYFGYFADPFGELSMDEFKKLKKRNDYL